MPIPPKENLVLQHLLLTDNDVEKIYEVALKTLETCGMMLQGCLLYTSDAADE